MPTPQSQPSLPELRIAPVLADAIGRVSASFPSLDEAETAALEGDIAAPLEKLDEWRSFCAAVEHSIDRRGYVVVRGLEADGGRSLLLVGRALGECFDTYRPGRIVKRFRMSPWTDELSHTTRAGDFHTDGNVAETPPAGTALQCEVEDPGAPAYAEQRVAFLPDLVRRLRCSGDAEDAAALRFLTESEAALAHEHTSAVWRGRLIEDGVVRYHPHSLRVAVRRSGEDLEQIETVIDAVHRAALDVSVPFHTRSGDTVLVSNRTALHYRGECSVRFTRFPTEFEARSLFVLHTRASTE